jgi:hypothetical protein
MRTRVLGAILMVFFSGAAGAAAQEPEEIALPPDGPAVGQVRIAPPVGQSVMINVGAGDPLEMPIDVLAVEPFDIGKPVTGAPYSAEITTEIVQRLADGNRIERRSTSSVARDAQGRVRREQQVTAIGPILPSGDARIVTISDPVAKVHYSLDAERKVAIQLPLRFEATFKARPRPSLEARNEKGELMPPHPVAARQATDARTETLGTREIEGVTADGTRITATIPAGAIGNQAPIEIVSERWYSPELQTVVFSRRSDPRFGETTYSLRNIVRVEPPAEIFQVPPDYTVEQARGLRINKALKPPGQ